ncbi:MAG: Uma2 family endonuclease [Cyanobacteria bacterium P01_E01_bin.42]
MVVSPVALPIRSLELSPGSHLIFNCVSWEEYEVLLEELTSDRRIPRINYCNGILELMAPLPAHERPHRIIGYIVAAMLDFQERDWEDFGSTTFKKMKQAGLEPDTCFYIKNAEIVRSLQRIDLETDPPPDLAIESDLTSKTTLDAYAAIAVPELWIFSNGRLKIYVLTKDGYQESNISPTFPAFNIIERIPRLVEEAFNQGTRKMLRSLRQSLSRY